MRYKSNNDADFDPDFDVVIVGAGPAGSTMAARLARAGLAVAIVDKATFPRDKPCGEYLSPEIVRLFEELGIIDRIMAAGPAILKGMRVWTVGNRGFQGDFSSDPARPIDGLSLPRLKLDHLLLEYAREQGAQVFEGFNVKQLIQPGAQVMGIQGQFADETVKLSGRLIIGADGVNSVVVRRLGLRQEHRWLNKVAFVTHYAGLTDCGPYGEMYVERRGYCGVAPLGQNLFNVAVVVDAERARRWTRDIEANFLAATTRHPRLAARMKLAERVKPIIAIGPLAVKAIKTTAPGVILIGDAACYLDPFTGQGVFAAVHNSQIAAQLLLRYWEKTGPAPQFYDEYEVARKQESGKWRLCSLIQLAIRYPFLMDLFARRLNKRKSLADVMVGVTGDFLPTSAVLSASYLARLLL